MKPIRRPVAILLACLSIMVLPGVLFAQKSDDATPSPEDAPFITGGRADPAARDEFTAVITAHDLQLDPRKSYSASEAQVFTALYEGLFTYKPTDGSPEPALAERWSVSEDRMTWTIELRKDARYSNGDPILAIHVRDTWLSMISPTLNAPYASMFDVIIGAREYRSGQLKDPAKVGIKVMDARTLVITLNAPASFFRSLLCHHSFVVLHPSLLGVEDFSKATLVSNGPFTLTSNDGETVVLYRNPEYWDAQNVAFRRINLINIDDNERAAALWDSGAAQWILGNVDFEAIRDRSGLRLDPMFATHYYFFRSAEEPWTNPKVRKALAMAFLWEKLRESSGYLFVADSLVLPSFPGYPDLEGRTKSDLEQARKLLAEAGYPGGEGLPELVIRMMRGDSGRVTSLMQEAWGEGLGVKVRIEEVPISRYYEALDLNGYVIGAMTWIGDFADPYTFLQMWMKDSNLNNARFASDEYERLIARSMNEDGQIRMKTLGEAERLLLDSGAVYPIYYSPADNVINTDEIDGWYPNPLNIHPFKYLKYASWRPLPGVAALDGREVRGN